MRPAPDVQGLGYFGTAGSWGWVPFAPVPGDDPHVSEPQAYVPVIYFAPTKPTTKLFIVHDGHAPYDQPGHRALIHWALDHGFGVAQVIMPYFGHDLIFTPPWSLWPPNYGDVMRIFTYAGDLNAMFEQINSLPADDPLRQPQNSAAMAANTAADRAADEAAELRMQQAANRPPSAIPAFGVSKVRSGKRLSFDS